MSQHEVLTLRIIKFVPEDSDFLGKPFIAVHPINSSSKTLEEELIGIFGSVLVQEEHLSTIPASSYKRGPYGDDSDWAMAMLPATGLNRVLFSDSSNVGEYYKVFSRISTRRANQLAHGEIKHHSSDYLTYFGLAEPFAGLYNAARGTSLVDIYVDDMIELTKTSFSEVAYVSSISDLGSDLFKVLNVYSGVNNLRIRLNAGEKKKILDSVKYPGVISETSLKEVSTIYCNPLRGFFYPCSKLVCGHNFKAVNKSDKYYTVIVVVRLPESASSKGGDVTPCVYRFPIEVVDEVFAQASKRFQDSAEKRELQEKLRARRNNRICDESSIIFEHLHHQVSKFLTDSVSRACKLKVSLPKAFSVVEDEEEGKAALRSINPSRLLPSTYKGYYRDNTDPAVSYIQGVLDSADTSKMMRNKKCSA